MTTIQEAQQLLHRVYYSSIKPAFYLYKLFSFQVSIMLLLVQKSGLLTGCSDYPIYQGFKNIPGGARRISEHSRNFTAPPLKNDAWKTILSFWVSAFLIRGKLSNFQAVSFHFPPILQCISISPFGTMHKFLLFQGKKSRPGSDQYEIKSKGVIL